MWLIAGLGNPGASYQCNRHNVGFMLVDVLAHKYRYPAFASKHQALLAQGHMAETKALLCMPQTFMNLSGQAVGEVCRFYKIPPEKVLVLHDELDLPLGKIRIKRGGGHGGHNGLRDIDRHIGQDYWRMRIGIGHPGHKDAVHGYVLSDFAKPEREPLAAQLDVIAQQLPLMFSAGHEALMTKIALAMKGTDATTATKPAKE